MQRWNAVMNGLISSEYFVIQVEANWCMLKECTKGSAIFHESGHEPRRIKSVVLPVKMLRLGYMLLITGE